MFDELAELFTVVDVDIEVTGSTEIAPILPDAAEETPDC